MFYEQRFSNDGPSTARPEQADNRYDEVYEKYGEITHHCIIVTDAPDLTRLGNLSRLCEEQ